VAGETSNEQMCYVMFPSSGNELSLYLFNGREPLYWKLYYTVHYINGNI